MRTRGVAIGCPHSDRTILPDPNQGCNPPARSLIVGGRLPADLEPTDLEPADLKPADLAPADLESNEWAPVHSSIAGPYIFVLSEGFLVKTSVFSESQNAWPLRSDPADMF